MGYIRHHSIVVTTWDKDKVKIVYDKAKEIFGANVSEIVNSNINGYQSFFVAPDGSKEGWEESEQGDKNRASFLEFIEQQKYEDDSNSISFAELFYGDDEGESEIVNHN